MRKLIVLLPLTLLIAGCTVGNNNSAPTPTFPSSTTPITVVDTLPSQAATKDPLDFSNLPENQRPVLACIPVSAEDTAHIGSIGGGYQDPAYWSDDYSGEPQWRVEMGEGNQPGETWSLTSGGYLTNYWSDYQPNGPIAIGVGWPGLWEGITGDFWDGKVEWSTDRINAGRAVEQWIADHCH